MRPSIPANLMFMIKNKLLDLCFFKFAIGWCMGVKSQLHQLLAVVTFMSRSKVVVIFKDMIKI